MRRQISSSFCRDGGQHVPTGNRVDFFSIDPPRGTHVLWFRQKHQNVDAPVRIVPLLAVARAEQVELWFFALAQMVGRLHRVVDQGLRVYDGVGTSILMTELPCARRYEGRNPSFPSPLIQSELLLKIL